MNFSFVVVYATIASLAVVVAKLFDSTGTYYERLRTLPLVILLLLFALNYPQALYNPLFNWSVVALMFAISGELLMAKYSLAGMLCYPISHLFNSIGFQEIDWTLDGIHFLVAALIWIVFAVWISHLFWVYQHRTLLVPMNIQLAVLMFLTFSAYNAEKTLRRNMPWYFISSFFYLLSDAIFVLDEFISRIPFATALILLVYYAAAILSTIGTLTLPNQGLD